MPQEPGPPRRDPGTAFPFHSTALLFWLLAALAPSVLTRNPLYLAVALGLMTITHQVLAKRSPTAGAWGSFARLAIFFVLVTLAINVLLGAGGETTIFELPAWKVTGDEGRILFQVGGPVTLESLLFGLTTALALLSVILALATFNTLADHYQLLRSLPDFLYQTATVVSIALAFMPQLVEAQREIREAQALREHRIRGLRDLLPLVMTLLAEGLERAITLAESMEARGFAGPPRGRFGELLPRLLIALGLGLLAIGAVGRGLWPESGAGLWMLAAGGLLLAGTLYGLGRRVRRSRFRSQAWRPRDTWLAGISLAALGGFTALVLADARPLHYELFPQAHWPPFEALALVPMLAFLAPLVLFHPSRSEAP